MPIYYRETVIDSSSAAGQRPYQPMPPQTQPGGGGQQSAAQQAGGTQTRRPPPQFQQQYSTGTSAAGGGGGQTTRNSSRTEEYSRTESGNWPSNFPKIPPPQGIVDDAQLERMAATQQQKWAPQPQRGEPPLQQQTAADEPSNTIYYEQKVPPLNRETTMTNQQQKQPSMEQTATGGQQPNVPKGQQQSTTIYYEQKGGGMAQPTQNQAQQQFQQSAPAEQQKYTANFPSGQPQAMEQQPQRQPKSGQQPQQGESQESADKEDEPPPEMQLAEADPYSLKEQQQQQEYGSRQGGWPPLQEQPYAHKKQMQQQNGHPNYQEPLYVSAGQQPPDWDGHSPRNYQYFQQQPRGPQYYSPSSIGWDAVYGDDWALDGQMPPSFTTGPAWGDHLAYAQRVNLDRRRAESEQRKRHHSPVPGSAEHGYLFGGMDFVDHQQFDPYAYVGEPWDERQSRRDLHWGPPRRRGDFFGLDYATMPGERPPRPLSAEDAQNYQGYQALTPRKNFRLCGHITADPDAPLNIAEAQGLNELDSQYWVGDTLSNQRILVDHPLTDEEKRTFALLYGPGGFKPDHITVRPEPKPEEPVQFSVTIGPRKEYERRGPPPEGYVNPMKVEGESWILGNRDGYYGGHPTLHAAQTGGDHLAFHRPRNFPAHVPQWARQRMEQQGRGGARSLDRSLFAPAWSKMPQPQPPFWVKRDGSGAAGGFQMGGGQRPQKEAEGEQKEEEGEKMEIEGQKVAAQKQQMQRFKGQTQQPQKSSQQSLQQFEGQQKVDGQSSAPQKVPQQNEEMEEEECQSQAAPPQQQRAPPKMQPSAGQQRAQQNVQQKSQPQQQSQQIAYGGGGSFSKKMQEIHQQPKMQTTTNSSERQREEGGGGREAEWNQFTQPGGMDYAGQRQQQSSRGQQQGGGQQFQQPSYQLIVNPPKMHQGGIMPAKQPLTQRQEQQQQNEQQQQYYEFYEGRPMGQRQQQPSQIQPQGAKRTMGGGPPPSDGQWTQFTQPGGMAYGQGGQTQTQPRVWPSKNTRIVQQSGEVPLNSAEQETSGLENLAKIKLGEFPLRQRSLEEQQAAAAAGNGNIFVDAHGRPVQYVRETKLDPGTGQPVTREEWRLVEQQPRQPTAGGAQQFRPQNAARPAGPGAQPQRTSDAQWNQFTQPGGMDYGRQ